MWVLWFILCIGIGIFATTKGRSGLGWGILAVIISPLLAGVILALLKDLEVNEDIQKIRMEQQQTRDRVSYNEKLTEQRFASVENDVHRLKEGGGGNPSILNNNEQKAKLIESDYKLCLSCDGMIKSKAIKCKHCGVMVNEINQKECPYCKEYIDEKDTICNHCNSDLTDYEEGVFYEY